MPALQRTCPHLPSWLPDQNWGQISVSLNRGLLGLLRGEGVIMPKMHGTRLTHALAGTGSVCEAYPEGAGSRGVEYNVGGGRACCYGDMLS